MTAVFYVSMGILALAGVLAMLRLTKSTSLGDTAVVFDMITAVVTCALLVWAGYELEDLNLDLAVILGLLGFLSSVTVVRFIESRSGDDQ